MFIRMDDSVAVGILERHYEYSSEYFAVTGNHKSLFRNGMTLQELLECSPLLRGSQHAFCLERLFQ